MKMKALPMWFLNPEKWVAASRDQYPEKTYSWPFKRSWRLAVDAAVQVVARVAVPVSKARPDVVLPLIPRGALCWPSNYDHAERTWFSSQEKTLCGRNLMNLWNLVLKEAWQRRWRLMSSVLALVLAIGLIVTIQSLNFASRQTMHGYLKNLGANMVVIPAELDLFAYFSADPELLSGASIPESHFFRLFEARVEGIKGIDPRLIIPLRIGEGRVVLTGILPDKMLRPEAEEVEDEDPWKVLTLLSPESNGAVLGAELKGILNKEAGSTMRVSGREIKVLGILPQQGTIDDLRIYVHLRSLQKQFERPFSLNEIRILYTGNRALDVVASGIEGMLENRRVVTHRRMARKQIQTMGSICRYVLMRLTVIPVWVVSVWEMRCFTTPKRARGRSGSSWP
jgi:hypothetical protein